MTIERERIKNKHEAIGNIVHNHAIIESILAMWICDIASEDKKIGLILTSEMSFKLLMNALFSLLKYKAETNNKIESNLVSIKKLLDEIHLTEQQRNIYSHSLILHYEYSYDHEKFHSNDEDFLKVKITSKYKKGLNVDLREIKLKDLNSVIKKQVEIIGKLDMYSKLTGNIDVLNSIINKRIK